MAGIVQGGENIMNTNVHEPLLAGKKVIILTFGNTVVNSEVSKDIAKSHADSYREALKTLGVEEGSYVGPKTRKIHVLNNPMTADEISSRIRKDKDFRDSIGLIIVDSGVSAAGAVAGYAISQMPEIAGRVPVLLVAGAHDRKPAFDKWLGAGATVVQTENRGQLTVDERLKMMERTIKEFRPVEKKDKAKDTPSPIIAGSKDKTPDRA